MRIIAGKTVCETIEELTWPAESALVLVDVQNDYLASGGLDGRRGEFGEARARGIVPNMMRILQRARELNVLVVYLRYTRQADHRYESPATLRWMFVKRGYKVNELSTVEGSWGWEIIEDLSPRDGELIIDKRRPSGFHETLLDAMLQKRGIKSVILVGVSTHGCVEATARDAELRSYYVVPIEDCMAAYDNELHEAALTVMRSRYDVIDTARLLEAWSMRT
jgi:biuret amidohydrolase